MISLQMQIKLELLSACVNSVVGMPIIGVGEDHSQVLLLGLEH